MTTRIIDEVLKEYDGIIKGTETARREGVGFAADIIGRLSKYKDKELVDTVADVVVDYVTLLNVSSQLCGRMMELFKEWLEFLNQVEEYDPKEHLMELIKQLRELNVNSLKIIQTCLRLKVELQFLSKSTNAQQWGSLILATLLTTTGIALIITGILAPLGISTTVASTGGSTFLGAGVYAGAASISTLSESEVAMQLSVVLGVIGERCNIIQGYAVSLHHSSDAAIIRLKTHNAVFITAKVKEILTMLQEFQESITSMKNAVHTNLSAKDEQTKVKRK